MKKAWIFIVALLLAISSLNVNSMAYDEVINENIIVEDIISSRKTSKIYIESENTAKCKSSFECNNQSFYSVKVEQTLEKHYAFGIFLAVNDAYWNQTFYTDNITMTNYKYSLDSGTYRLKTVFTVTLTNGGNEIVTVYSSEKTI